MVAFKYTLRPWRFHGVQINSIKFNGMQKLLTPIFVAFMLVALCLPVYGQNNPADIQEQCNNITAQQRQLAQQAGYNIDTLCSQFDRASQSKPEVAERAVIKSRPLTDDSDYEANSHDNFNARQYNNRQFNDSRDDFNARQYNNRQFNDSQELKSLKPFGYDLFAGEPESFTAANNIPIPTNYLLGPGDTLEILLYGKTNQFYSLKINRKGTIDFPSLGPVSLTGLSFEEAKELLLNRISKEMIGVEANISLGELRSIQVFVLGEAYKPGNYVISSLSTITNALFLSGGTNSIASLRNVQLKRAGETVANLDLYDLLLKGDVSNDKRLQEGDVIFIPSVEKQISVLGSVKRPAIYELKSERSVDDVIKLAGGFTNDAFLDNTKIIRNSNNGFKTVLDINLSDSKDKKALVEDGDIIKIDTVIDRRDSIVSLNGHVHRAGDYLWYEGIRVSDIFTSISIGKPNVDINYALIKRTLLPLGTIEMLYVNLQQVLLSKGSDDDIQLMPRDELIIFSSRDDKDESAEEFNRTLFITDLVEQLKAQANYQAPAKVVTIEGSLRFPGEYPLTKNMSISQLITVAGGMQDSAFQVEGEVTRIDLSNPLESQINHFKFALAAEVEMDDSQLQPYDVITIHRLPNFRERQQVTVRGEVKFPGNYTFKAGETLKGIIQRAGGLTNLAHLEAALFTRLDIKVKEQQAIEELEKRLRADTAATEIIGANDGKDLDVDSATVLDALQDAEAQGRLVINLSGILDGSNDDITLKDGDELLIPEHQQEITIVGEVQYPSTHAFKPSTSLKDYLKLSGGTTRKADKRHIYVVKADGSVKVPSKTWLFGYAKTGKLKIEPGDAIVVPLHADKKSILAVLSEATNFLYQLALGAAVVATL